MTINPDTLHPKFHPYLLGHPSCRSTVSKEEMDRTFSRPLRELRVGQICHTFDAEAWILKRDDADDLYSTHLYRVRQAEKISKYISKHNLGFHLVVPQKYLYWHESERRFYVVSEKIKLSETVAQPASKEIEEHFKTGQAIGGQVAALAQRNMQIALTSIQAKALAELSLLRYDLAYNNLYFTHDGRVAILDTYPKKKRLNKQFKANLFFKWLGNKKALLTQQAIAGIAKLKLYCHDSNALKEVKKVERNLALSSLAKLVGEIALLALSIYFTPSAITLLSSKTAALTTVIKISAITVLTGRIFSLTGYALGVLATWANSSRGLEGMWRITERERKGFL